VANADAVSVYCVLALYVPPYIIKLSFMVYVDPENRDPTDFGMGPPEGLFRPWPSLTVMLANVKF